MPRQRIRRRVGNGSVLMGNGVFETPSPTPCTLLCRAKREAASPFSLPINIIKRIYNQLRNSSLHHHYINAKKNTETTTILGKNQLNIIISFTFITDAISRLLRLVTVMHMK